MKKNMKKEQRDEITTDDAEHEAYAPHATLIGNQDFVIRTCDGDDEYVYLAVMRKSTYHVTEVYPGLNKKETNVREAYELKDLTFSSGKHKTIEAVVAELRAMIFENFEFGEREHKALPSGDKIFVGNEVIPRRLSVVG